MDISKYQNDCVRFLPNIFVGEDLHGKDELLLATHLDTRARRRRKRKDGKSSDSLA